MRCDAGLLNSLREEVEVWKAKFQEQVEATAAAAVQNGDGEGGDPVTEKLDKALEDAAQAQEEASRWKEKAIASQELEGTFYRLHMPSLCKTAFCSHHTYPIYTWYSSMYNDDDSIRVFFSRGLCTLSTSCFGYHATP